MKKVIKDSLKMIASQFMMITTILLSVLSVIYLITHKDGTTLPWYFPLQVIGISASTSIISIIFVSNHEQSRKEFVIRCIIHFILLTALVLGEGFIFKWWNEALDMLVVIAVLLIVYAGVWIGTLIGDKKTSDNINKALKEIPKNKDED